MKDRIKAIRKHLHLTQSQFGEKIGVKGNTVTTYESGDRYPSNAVIDLICAKFSVSEKWLRTGSGSMFYDREQNISLSYFLGETLADANDPIYKRFVIALSKATPEELKAVEQLAERIIAEKKKSGPG